MTTAQHIRVLVPAAVQAPRGALWAGAAAAWLWHAVHKACRKE